VPPDEPEQRIVAVGVGTHLASLSGLERVRLKSDRRGLARELGDRWAVIALHSRVEQQRADAHEIDAQEQRRGHTSNGMYRGRDRCPSGYSGRL
jgi:hypothetical protein